MCCLGEYCAAKQTNLSSVHKPWKPLQKSLHIPIVYFVPSIIHVVSDCCIYTENLIILQRKLVSL